MYQEINKYLSTKCKAQIHTPHLTAEKKLDIKKAKKIYQIMFQFDFTKMVIYIKLKQLIFTVFSKITLIQIKDYIMYL